MVLVLQHYDVTVLEIIVTAAYIISISSYSHISSITFHVTTPSL